MKTVYLETNGGRRRLEVSASFVQLYVDINYHLYKLKGSCALYLLFWLIAHMNKYNMIILNNAGRGEFSSDMVSKSGKRYADQTVRTAINELARNNLILSMNDHRKRESQYMINPMFFWKSPKQVDRMEAIKAFIYKKQQNEEN